MRRLLTASLVVCFTFVVSPAGHADELRNREYWLHDYGITKAWETSKGAGVKVAIIDSGVDGQHQDLQGAVVGGTDVSGAGTRDGQRGLGAKPAHGTLVASLLAGRGHGPGDQGVLGVAPEAQLLSISAWLGGPNPGGKSIDQQIPQAVKWAVDNGARVINMSLTSSSPSWPQSWDDAFLYAEEHDVVIVAAAGNSDSGDTQVGAPATIPGVVAVGGLKRDGTTSEGSSAPGITLAVAAPAENLVGALPGNGYADWNGSSGATPIVAGVAALIRAANPEMTAAQVINRVIRTAKPAGGTVPNNRYGWGTLDAAAALNANVATTTVNPLSTIREWITIHRRGAHPAPALEQTSNVAPSVRPTLPVAATPVAQVPARTDSPLPLLLLASFGVVILGILVAGTFHMLVVHRRRRSAAANREGLMTPSEAFHNLR